MVRALRLIAIAAVAATVLAWLIASPRSIQLAEERMTALEDRQAEIEQEIARNRALSRGNSDLPIKHSAALMGSMNKAIDRRSADPETVSSPEEPSGRTEQSDSAEREPREVRELLEAELQSEARDQEWSTAAGASVEQAFTSPTAAGNRLVANECRTTICRVEVEHDAEEDASRISEFENQMLVGLTNDFSGGAIKREGNKSVYYFKRRQGEPPSRVQ